MQVKRVALYARVSTNKDQQPDVQLNELRAYTNARGWIIHQEFVDKGWSGKDDKRPALQELIKSAHKREIDIVLVVKLDRLFRSLKHLINTLNDFSEIGIEFVAIRDNIDLTTPTGRFFCHNIFHSLLRPAWNLDLFS